MFLKTAFPILTVVALIAVGGSAWADGEHGSKAETEAYAARDAEASSLEEFSGGLLGGLLAAIVAFFSDAVQAIVDLFSADPDAPPTNDQGRCSPEGQPAPA
jgi:hypothetical protein